MNNTGIYLIKNLINGKVYTGSACNLKKRWNEHRCRLKKGTHHSPKLKNAWNKYGEDNFLFITIEYCDRDNLITHEQFWIDFYDSFNNGYNSTPKAGSNIGKIFSQEHKNKLKESAKKRVYTDYDRQRMSEGAIGKTPWNKGKKDIYSKETLKKMSDSRKGKTAGENHHMFGKTHKPESIIKMSKPKTKKNK